MIMASNHEQIPVVRQELKPLCDGLNCVEGSTLQRNNIDSSLPAGSGNEIHVSKITRTKLQTLKTTYLNQSDKESTQLETSFKQMEVCEVVSIPEQTQLSLDSSRIEIPVVRLQELKPLCEGLNCVEGSPLQRNNIDSSLPAGSGNETHVSKSMIKKLQGGTAPFEEEGRDHTYTYVDCYYERTDHQLQCNTTSADELAKTEGNTAVCQLSDSNSYKEDNDTKGVLPSVVYIRNNWSTSKLKEKFQRDPRVVHIDRNSLHEKQLHIKISNYREVLAGLDVPILSPAIFSIIEEDEANMHMFMELIDPYVSLGGLIRLGKKLGKSGAYYVINVVLKAVNNIHGKRWSHRDLHVNNILLQKIPREIPRIIDYGYAMELAGNKNDESYMGYDISMLSDAISNLCISLNDIDDPLLNRFRGKNREVLRNTEDVECLIKETAFEAAKFAEQYANKEHELMMDMFKSVH